MLEYMVSITFAGKTNVIHVKANGADEAAHAMLKPNDASPRFVAETNGTRRYTHERGTIRVTAL